jgi:hypothetical protein
MNIELKIKKSDKKDDEYNLTLIIEGHFNKIHLIKKHILKILNK